MIIGLLGQKGAGKDTAGAVLAKELNGTCLAFADPMKRFCMNALGLTQRQLWGDAKEKPISKKQLKRLRRYLPYTVPGDYSASNPPKQWAPPGKAQERGVLTPLADWLVLSCCWDLPHITDTHIEGGLRVWLRDLVETMKHRITPRYLLQNFGTEFGRQCLGRDFWIQSGLHVARHVLDGGAYDRTQGLAKRHGGSDVAVITDVRFRNEVLAIKRAGGKIVRIVRQNAAIRGAHHGAHASESEQLHIPDFWCDAVVHNNGSKAGFEGEVRLLAHHLTAQTYVYGVLE